MFLPHIKHGENALRQMISTFGGYNHNPVTAENEFYDMKNMTSDFYPVLSSRRSRKAYAFQGDMVMWVGDKRIALCPPCICIDAYEIDAGLSAQVEHQAVVSGAYLVVFPEGVYVNLTEPQSDGAWGLLSREVGITTHGKSYKVKLSIFHCDELGNERTIRGLVDTTGWPSDPNYYGETLDGTYWYSESRREVYQYVYGGGDDKMLLVGASCLGIRLTSYPMTLTCEEATSWMAHLKTGDFVTFEHFPVDASVLDGNHTVIFADTQSSGTIVVEGYLPQGNISVSLNTGDPMDVITPWRELYDPMPCVRFVIPPLDFVTACGNRLWGCRYGEAHNSEFVNEIYATALGDIHRWYNLADDSVADNGWISSVGHMGAFTGAVSYGGRPYFFKQDRIFAIYGDTPSTFGYTEIVERGVQAGCERSLVVLDGVLYYKALDGIVAFDGSSTALISSPLGTGRYTHGVSGGADGKYYICLTQKDSQHTAIFVYDARRGLWHKEDELSVTCFATDHSGDLWGIAGNTLYSFGQDHTGEVIPWMVETGIWGLDDPDKKYISRLSLRLALAIGAYVKVSIQYDSIGEFEQVLFYEGVNLQTIALPITPRRCDHMRLRIEGVGKVRIYSLTKTITGGSDT